MGWVPPGNNCLTQAEDNIAGMLINTAAFQEWVGVDGVPQAEPYVFYHSLPSPDDTRWPHLEETFDAEWFRSLQNYVVLYTAVEEGFALEYSASPNDFLPSGVVTVEFMRFYEIDGDERWGEHTRSALEEIGGILVAASALTNTAGYPSINRIVHVISDWEIEDQQPDVGRHFRSMWDFEWTMGNNASQ